jgi:hypothetical protein
MESKHHKPSPPITTVDTSTTTINIAITTITYYYRCLYQHRQHDKTSPPSTHNIRPTTSDYPITTSNSLNISLPSLTHHYHRQQQHDYHHRHQHLALPPTTTPPSFLPVFKPFNLP